MDKTFLKNPIYLLLLCSFLAFLPSLKNGFTWDDFPYITQNKDIQQLAWPNLKAIFTTSFNGSYHPLTQLSFAVEYQWVKLNPFLYHLDNLLLHAINTVLVFSLLRRIVSVDLALITALLFAIHPQRVESVAWAAERKDVLFSFFYLWGMIYYIRRKLRTCFVFFILAVLAKPQAVSLPLALLSLDYLSGRKWDRIVLKEKTLFFAITFWTMASTFLGEKHVLVKNHILGGSESFSFIDKFLFTAYAFILYIWKCIFPYPLSVIYFYPAQTDGRWPWLVYLAPFFILILWVVTVRLKNRLITWGLLFFSITIFLPLGSTWAEGHMMADRFSYLPSIGLLLILSMAGLFIYKKFPFTKWLFFIYAMFLFISSFLRCGVWKDYVTMTSEIIRQNPHSADTYFLRGQIYVDNGQYDLALKDFSRSIELAPQYALEYYERANVYVRDNDFDSALKDYSMALQLDPTLIDARNNRGYLYLLEGHNEKAIEDFKKILELSPDHVLTITNLGLAYVALGKPALAKEAFDRALKLDPHDERALQQTQKMLKLNPR